MRILPYLSFDTVHFGDDATSVIRALGPPESQNTAESGELELTYPTAVVRISKTDGVVECSAKPESVQIEGATIDRRDLARFLLDNDARAVGNVGFVISPRFGVAIDTEPDHGAWITVFSRGRWDELAE